MKKKILWITASWSYDTDKEVVPTLIKDGAFDIDWWVINDVNSKVELDGFSGNIYTMQSRQRSIHRIMEYRNFFITCGLKAADMIYSDELGAPYYYPALLWCKDKKTPIVHAAHNVVPYGVWPWWMKIYVKYVLRRNKYFHFFSKSSVEYFNKRYTGKKYFLAPMVMKGYGKARTNNYFFDETKINLLFFGNVAGNKRLDLLIDAIKQLPKEKQDMLHLNICGNCKSGADSYIQQIGDSKCISTYFKRIPDEEIPELFIKSDYLVLPYQDVAQSGPQMIAYYYNTPVIASDIEGFSERVIDGENGYLFKRNDVENLKEVLIKVTNLNQEGYNAMKLALKEYADKNYSASAISSKYIKFFKSII